MTQDIRMKIVEQEEGREFTKSLAGQWIYIKLHNRKDEYYSGMYAKFKVRNVNLYTDDCYIYGEEDDDCLYIRWDKIIQVEMTEERDECLFRYEDTEIYVRIYNPMPDSIDDIISVQKNLIITEGKSDWKLLKAALEYFRKNGKYTSLDVSFLEFEENLTAGKDKMMRVRDYNAIFTNDNLRIFIFDADDKEINKEHEGVEIKNCKNNVYSFILPVPEHRKGTPLISIENYFTDEEIMTKDENERRLYLRSEFNDYGYNKKDSSIIAYRMSNMGIRSGRVSNDKHICGGKTISTSSIFSTVYFYAFESKSTV